MSGTPRVISISGLEKTRDRSSFYKARRAHLAADELPLVEHAVLVRQGPDALTVVCEYCLEEEEEEEEAAAAAAAAVAAVVAHTGTSTAITTHHDMKPHTSAN